LRDHRVVPSVDGGHHQPINGRNRRRDRYDPIIIIIIIIIITVEGMAVIVALPWRRR